MSNFDSFHFPPRLKEIEQLPVKRIRVIVPVIERFLQDHDIPVPVSIEPLSGPNRVACEQQSEEELSQRLANSLERLKESLPYNEAATFSPLEWSIYDYARSRMSSGEDVSR